ncbi:hypothetical protein LTR56_015613 [Elasticomyces elasticus]|nr:hypothetical protein LTR56_015613 [Elasticomyces elasticus]KAK4919246.1 hypothetical protein LTR49_013093 [Elasticomyces elasticus]KAK5757803.1 hypothetical protein LTS12_012121 [Elasticomyces elasticus]
MSISWKPWPSTKTFKTASAGGSASLNSLRNVTSGTTVRSRRFRARMKDWWRRLLLQRKPSIENGRRLGPLAGVANDHVSTVDNGESGLECSEKSESGLECSEGADSVAPLRSRSQVAAAKRRRPSRSQSRGSEVDSRIEELIGRSRLGASYSERAATRKYPSRPRSLFEQEKETRRNRGTPEMVDGGGSAMRELATRHGFVLKRMPSRSQSRRSDVGLSVEELYGPSGIGVLSESVRDGLRCASRSRLLSQVEEEVGMRGNCGGAQEPLGPWFDRRRLGSVRSTHSLNSRRDLFSEKLALLPNDAAPEGHRVKAVDYSPSFGGRGRRLGESGEEEGRRDCPRRCLRGYECVCSPMGT